MSDTRRFTRAWIARAEGGTQASYHREFTASGFRNAGEAMDAALSDPECFALFVDAFGQEWADTARTLPWSLKQ